MALKKSDLCSSIWASCDELRAGCAGVAAFAAPSLTAAARGAPPQGRSGQMDGAADRTRDIAIELN
jgi:hypothetical protein